MYNAQTPLYDAIVQHARHQKQSFHVPGHKNGTVFPEKARAHFHALLPIDLTELSGLDDLHSPEGAIAKAQQLLAEFYGSDRSYFLIGGSTVGNLAMMLSVCSEGDTVLIQRNCHQSVMHALDLARAQPVFLAPVVDKESALATAPDFQTVCEALERYPDAKALVLTHPNYYGMAVDIGTLIRQAHTHDIPVLVDEAHGAHFVLGTPFPDSALACGADAVVQSAHKTLPAMTMGAFLHTCGPRISQRKLEKSLRILQSSSPSYPIMASLDLARNYMAQLTEDEIRSIYSEIEKFRSRLGQFPQLSVVGPSPSEAYTALDPLKVTVQTNCQLNGFEIQRRLEKQGLYTELADPYHVLLIMPLARFDQADMFMAAIETALSGIRPNTKPLAPQPLEIPRLSRPARLSEEHPAQRIPLEKAAGHISAQEVTPYPPGVPLLLEGEVISTSQVTAMRNWDAVGGRFQTGGDLFTKGIRVSVDIADYGTMTERT